MKAVKGKKSKNYVKNLGKQSGYTLILLGVKISKHLGSQPKSLKFHVIGKGKNQRLTECYQNCNPDLLQLSSRLHLGI